MAVAAMAPLASHTNSGEVVTECEAGAVVPGQPGSSPHLQLNSSEVVENSWLIAAASHPGAHQPANKLKITRMKKEK
jgi:hypothetical protein